jgi:hypothetical protein
MSPAGGMLYWRPEFGEDGTMPKVSETERIQALEQKLK